MGILHKLYKQVFPSANKKKVVTDTVCCAGCKHLFYWCDGSVGCDIEREHDCIPEGFILREEREHDS